LLGGRGFGGGSGDGVLSLGSSSSPLLCLVCDEWVAVCESRRKAGNTRLGIRQVSSPRYPAFRCRVAENIASWLAYSAFAVDLTFMIEVLGMQGQSAKSEVWK